MRTQPGHKRYAAGTVRRMFTLHTDDVSALQEIAEVNGLARNKKGEPNLSAALRFLIAEHQASTNKQ